MKSAVKKSLRRSKKEGYAEGGPLRSGYLSASTDLLISKKDEEEIEESDTSIVSNDPLRIPPLRPVSKFMSILEIADSVNELPGSLVAEHFSIEDGFEDADSESESLSVAPLLRRSSNLASESDDDSNPGETPFCRTNENDDVFFDTNETSLIERPVTDFTVKLHETMETDRGYKTPSTAATASSAPATPSPPPKLRHTALKRTLGSPNTSLRSQYSAGEPASSPSVLGVPRVGTVDESAMDRPVQVAPSLEEGLFADNLDIYKENAVAAPAPVLRGIRPRLVSIRKPQVGRTLVQQDPAVSDRSSPVKDLGSQSILSGTSNHYPPTMMPATSHAGLPAETAVAMPSAVPEPLQNVSSASGPIVRLPTMPLPVLETIIVSAAYGDAGCRALACDLYKEVIEGRDSGKESRWGNREQFLILKSHLVQELEFLTRLGFLRDGVFQIIRGQLFSTRTTVMLGNRGLKSYIRRTVTTSYLGRDWAKEVLELLISDEGFAQCAPEEEVLLEHRLFNSEGYVYGDGASTGAYRRLASTPSTVSMFEPVEPRSQTGCWSSFLAKSVQVFRLGRWKRKL